MEGIEKVIFFLQHDVFFCFFLYATSNKLVLHYISKNS